MIELQPSSKQAQNLQTEIILVYGSLRTGGIETLIVRIANFFVLSGLRVSVFCIEGGGLESLLDTRVNVIAYSETRDLIRTVRTHPRHGNPGSDVLLMSFDPISAARALMIETELSKIRPVIHVSGVFHPRAYFMSGEGKDRIFLNHLLFYAIGEVGFFFMNEECRKTHSTKFGFEFSGSPLLALPINWVNAMWQPSHRGIVRVVSVGRLVDFKTYNLGAARIVRECLNRGVEVMWDIFGDGPLQGSVMTEIEEMGVASLVRLLGRLDYDNFSATVANYDLFIGMGTAALEAAMVGVPTICTTVDEATRCYGYLYDLPFGNVGELQANLPNVEIADLIHSYSVAGPAQRVHFSRQSRAMAENYGMPMFAEAVMNMVVIRHASPHKFIKYVVGQLYYFATESWIVKEIRRQRWKRRFLRFFTGDK